MDSEHDDSADSERETAVAQAGPQLRAAREALELELPSIAADTRIPLRHLEAIEEGKFDSLPSRAYAIGFSRTFAKAVGLDPAMITDAVRSELADGRMKRKMPSADMEPGDPARLPSTGLAWAGGIAAVLLLVGAIAFYRSYFGAGTQPGSLISNAPAATPTPAAQPSAAPAAPVTGGEVVLTALADRVWLRLYENGGERLLERTLRQGETVIVPPAATDPRINTGRPDALGITVAGQPIAKLADRAMSLSGVPVSATALLARDVLPAPDLAAPTPTPTPTIATASTPTPAPAPRPTPREVAPATRGDTPSAPDADDTSSALVPTQATEATANSDDDDSRRD